MILDLRRFIERERPIWDELDQLLRRMENDPAAKLTLADAERAHYLYERTSSALVRITTFAAEPTLIAFLQGLVARAYSELNDNRARTRKFRLRTWFFITFPRTFRQYRRYFWFALLLTVAGGIFGGGAITFDPQAKPILLAEFPHLLGNPADRVREEEHSTSSRLEGEHTSFSAYLMTHNARVALSCLALGMTWAIGTIILVFYNGVILGAVIADYIRAGQSVFLAGWLLPHGVIEIPAILIASQGGLLLGQALIGWGSDQTIGQRLRQISNPLVTLACGACLLLVWAGIVESFLSQYHAPVIPYFAKISFGILELAALIFFLGFSGSKASSGSRSHRSGTTLVLVLVLVVVLVLDRSVCALGGGASGTATLQGHSLIHSSSHTQHSRTRTATRLSSPKSCPTKLLLDQLPLLFVSEVGTTRTRTNRNIALWYEPI